MKQLQELLIKFPLSTQEVAKKLARTDARIRQIAPNIEIVGECIKIGNTWKFSSNAIDIIRQQHLGEQNANYISKQN